jgi:hypothetical protein
LKVGLGAGLAAKMRTQLPLLVNRLIISPIHEFQIRSAIFIKAIFSRINAA